MPVSSAGFVRIHAANSVTEAHFLQLCSPPPSSGIDLISSSSSPHVDRTLDDLIPLCTSFCFTITAFFPRVARKFRKTPPPSSPRRQFAEKIDQPRA